MKISLLPLPRLFTLLIVLSLSAAGAVRAMSPSLDIGTLGTRQFTAPALGPESRQYFYIRTTQQADANSQIYILFQNTGGCGYYVDLYAGSVRVGTSSMIEAALQGTGGLFALGGGQLFYGMEYGVSPGWSVSVLPLQGLPAGDYKIVVSRTARTGQAFDYQITFKFPGGTSGGPVGGVTTGGNPTAPVEEGLGEDGGPNGVLPGAQIDGIKFLSPTQGAVYESTPELQGEVLDYGVQTMKTRLLQLDAAGAPTGIVDWQTGGVADKDDNYNGSAFVLAYNWHYLLTVKFPLPRPALPPGNYQLRTTGYFYYLGVPIEYFHAKVSFRIEPPKAPASPAQDAAIAIGSPSAGQKFSAGTAVKIHGTASGSGVNSVALALIQLDASAKAQSFFNFSSQTWEGMSTQLTTQNFMAAAGVSAWSAQLPAALAAGQYRVVAVALFGSDTISDLEAVDVEITPAPPTGGGNTGGGNTGGGNDGGGEVPSAPVAGLYDGSITPEEDSWSVGQLRVSVTASGEATGKLIFGGQVFPFKTTLSDGQTFTQEFPRSGDAPVVMRLTPDFGGEQLDAEFDSGRDFLWKSRAERAAYSSGNPAPHTGACKLRVDEARAEWETAHPEGRSKARLKFTIAGRFTCAGRLADGTPFSAGGIVHPGGESDTFAFALPLRSKRDPLGSMLTASGGEVSGGTAPAAQMSTDWVRAPKASRAQFPEGFWLCQHFTSAQ